MDTTTSSLVSYNVTDDVTNDTTSSDFEKYNDIIANPGVRYTLITFHIILSVIAIIGNGIVLLVIYKRRTLRRNPTIIFIINLAFCDLVQCAFYRPLLLVDLFMPFTNDRRQDYQYGENYCKTMTFFQCMFAAVGFHTIVAISQERVCLIVFPLKAKTIFTTGRTRKLMVLIWVLAAACCLPIPVTFARIIEVSIGGTIVKYCGVFGGNIGGILFFSGMSLVYFLIPFIVISISYSKIFFTLYHRNKNLDAAKEKKDFRILRLRRNLAKMMVAVAVIFVICWGPHFIFYTYVGLGGNVPYNAFFTATIMDIMPIVSSCLNPFVYTINSRTFRKGMSSMVLRSGSSRRSFNESIQNTFGSPYYRQSSLMSQDSSERNRTDRKISLIGSRSKGDVMM